MRRRQQPTPGQRHERQSALQRLGAVETGDSAAAAAAATAESGWEALLIRTASWSSALEPRWTEQARRTGTVLLSADNPREIFLSEEGGTSRFSHSTRRWIRTSVDQVEAIAGGAGEWWLELLQVPSLGVEAAIVRAEGEQPLFVVLTRGMVDSLLAVSTMDAGQFENVVTAWAASHAPEDVRPVNVSSNGPQP